LTPPLPASGKTTPLEDPPLLLPLLEPLLVLDVVPLLALPVLPPLEPLPVPDPPLEELPLLPPVGSKPVLVEGLLLQARSVEQVRVRSHDVVFIGSCLNSRTLARRLNRRYERRSLPSASSIHRTQAHSTT
jgi:hypothetical protein